MKINTCDGSLMAVKGERRIIDCRRCGYIHVDPMYDKADLEKFYADHYAESTPSHLFQLKVHNVGKLMPAGEVLDLGCWTGLQLDHFQAAGWQCTGLEVNKRAAQEAAGKGFEVISMPFDAFIKENQQRIWNVVNAAYILEHIPHPGRFLTHMHRLLDPNGVLIVEVPNEFNPLQLCYVDRHKVEPYWVVLPDHVNYFTQEGIERLIASSGWKILHAESSFPMEMFLLMGDDYRLKPEIGPICFQKVVVMESSIMEYDIQLLSDLYTQLYRRGIGRSLIYYLGHHKD